MKWIALHALVYACNYIDADDDGKISMKEIRDFTKQVQQILKP